MNKYGLFIVFMAIFAVGLFLFKAFNNKDNIMENNSVELDIRENFNKVANMHKEGDVTGLINYWKEAGFEFEESSITKDNLLRDYDRGFKDIIENSISNVRVEYNYGEYDDKSKYVELIYSGNTDQENEIIKITHTFDFVGDRVYWGGYEINIKGEGPEVPASDTDVNIGL